jgi:pullulanase
MTISDVDQPDIDPNYEYVVLLANADKSPQQFTLSELRGLPFVLHPVQVNSVEPIVKTASFDQRSGEFSIPARTTAIFVLPQG